MPTSPTRGVWRRATFAAVPSALMVACGGGGGGSGDEPLRPPSVVVLAGKALYAERITLNWTADEINVNQAYALTVNGVVSAYTAQKAHVVAARPDTRYCFTVVVGALLPPSGSFGVTGPTSNELCVTTPSLPPLAAGWSVGDAGFGGGDFPAIARRAPASVSGLYACVAGAAGTAVFGPLGSRGMLLPTFARPGEVCAVTDNAAFMPAVDALTRAGATLAYRQAVPANGSWSFTGDETVAADAAATAVSMALDADQRPQVLFVRNGQAYWSGRDALGQWTAAEAVGPGVGGWRSLAVATDGTVFALLADGDTVLVRRRDAPGRWTTVYSAGGTPAAHDVRGPGSIVAAAGGGVRLAYRRTDGVGYVEWPGGAAPWASSLVDAGTETAAPAVAMDLAGDPVIAYGDAHADLRLSRRIAGQWHTVVIDALGDLARHTDVEVDAEGLVRILYSDESGAAKLATGR